MILELASRRVSGKSQMLLAEGSARAIFIEPAVSGTMQSRRHHENPILPDYHRGPKPAPRRRSWSRMTPKRIA